MKNYAEDLFYIHQYVFVEELRNSLVKVLLLWFFDGFCVSPVAIKSALLLGERFSFYLIFS